MPWHIVFSEDLCPFPSISRLQQIYQTDCSHSLVSARTHSISRYIRSSGYIYIQTFYIHKRNVLGFLRHGIYHVVARGGSHFCQSLKVGGQEFFSLKRKGGPTLFSEDNIKIPQPPQEKTYFSQRKAGNVEWHCSPHARIFTLAVDSLNCVSAMKELL